MDQPALYADPELSRFYDALYEYKDYRAEADVILRLIKRYQQSSGKDLLDVACGSGKHLKYFKRGFKCVGVDLYPSILKQAQENVPGVQYRRADMTSLSLEKQFDVITCLFSSIGYVQTLSKLQKTMQRFSQHLKPGGVVIVEPWFFPHTFRENITGLTPVNLGSVVGARLMRARRRGRASTLEDEYLFSVDGGPIKHYQDVHRLGLFTKNEQLEAMRKAGLRATFRKSGLILFKSRAHNAGRRKSRGMFIGFKPLK